MRHIARLLLITLSTTFMLIPNDVSGYNLRQISKKDGLTNSAILSMCQDQDGFMWLGSCDGLNMFDGISVSNYKLPAGKLSLSGNLIESIVETEDGILWVQTNYGLDRVDKKQQTIESFHAFHSNYKLRQSSLFEMFFITENGLFTHYDSANNEFKQQPLKNLPHEDLLDYVMDENDVLWLFCSNGHSVRYGVESDDNGEAILGEAIKFDHQNDLKYAFHDSNVVYFIDDTYTLYEYNLIDGKKYYVANIREQLSHKSGVSAIVKHKDDYFIGFQTDGLICLRNTPDKPNSYALEQIDIRLGIFCLLKDSRQDIVWIGTDGQGVYIYSDDPYSFKSTLLANFTHTVNKPIRSFLLDSENSLWIATKGDGIIKILDYDFNKNATDYRVEHYTTSNSALNNNSVFSVVKGTHNTLWIGSDQGLCYYNYRDRAIRALNVMIDGEQLCYVHDIHQQSDSMLYIATVGTGVVRVKIGWREGAPVVMDAKRFVIRSGAMSSNYFFTIYPENDSILWFGNRGHGAFRFNTQTETMESLKFDSIGNNQTINDIFCMTGDKEGNLWLGSSFGLIKHRPDGMSELFNDQTGFPNNTIHGVLKDGESNLWLSTNQGLVRFNTELSISQTFDQSTGMGVVEFSDGAYYKDEQSNTMLFGGIDGFIAIKKSDYMRDDFTPPIVFDRLSIFGEEHNINDFLKETKGGDKSLKLAYKQNFFSLSFVALDYISGNNYTYMYRLEGLNDLWIDNGKSNHIYFTNMAHGDYTLHIKYRNRETGIESVVQSINIRIVPPWYVSTTAKIVYIVLVLLGIYLLGRMYVRRSESRNKKLLDNLLREHQQEVYESKLSFFTNIAQEFCTPLTLIQGPCERIIEHKYSDSFVIKYASLIQRNAERMNALIEDLIEFRRVDTGSKKVKIEQLAVSELIEEMSENFVELAESREINFVKNIEPSVRWSTDKSFLDMIVSNLISNAFKYTNDKGTVTLHMSVMEGLLHIEISNTGKGIRQENLEMVFDRYTILDSFENHSESATTRNKLGLAISYSMVRLLRGEINVRSDRGRQTDFIVTLPMGEAGEIVQEEDAMAEMFQQISTTPAKEYREITEVSKYPFNRNRPTLLIIDGDMEMLWFLSEIFIADYNVIPVNDSSQVEQMLTETHPNVIICDVMIPNIDGVTLTRRIKANPKTAHVPLILISAKHAVEEQIEGLEAGAEMYISKPFNIDYLKIFVKHLISRKETLKEYFSSPISAYQLSGGKLTHQEHQKFVQQILDIINVNIANKELSAQFIADKMNMSTRHLYRKIKEIGANSPLDMIRESRLYIAQDLLLNSKLTIDEIIYKSGFSNRAPFFRAFSEKNGCTPREFRRRAEVVVPTDTRS